jgi:hypothetical protein
MNRPFAYPIRRCDDAAQEMWNCEYAITLDYDSGFWQMLIESQSRDKTGFFTPDGKKHYNHLPMGINNAAPAYVCMTDQLNQIWEGEFFQSSLGAGDHRDVSNTLSNCISS